MSCQYCGGDNCGSSAGGRSMCEESDAEDREDQRMSYHSALREALPSPRSWPKSREPRDESKVELLWRTRMETTLNHFQSMQRDMATEEDAAKHENQRAYFAGAARAWELAVTQIDKLLRL